MFEAPKWLRLAIAYKLNIKPECVAEVIIKNEVVRHLAALLVDAADIGGDPEGFQMLVDEWCGRARLKLYEWFGELRILAEAPNGATKTVRVFPRLHKTDRITYERWELLVERINESIKAAAAEEELEQLRERVKQLEEELDQARDELEKLRKENEELRREIENCRPVDECRLYKVRYPIKHPGQLAGVLRRLGCM